MSFVHLHRHSEWSLLDGTGSAEQYAKRAAEMEQPALALTDHATLSGILHHIKACAGLDSDGNRIHEPIIPIVGCEVYYRDNRKLHQRENKEYWHMVLLAKNIEGWRSLLRITSEAYASGFYYKPCVDPVLLEENNEGIICGTACMSGYAPDCISRNDSTRLNAFLDFLDRCYGDDWYVEIMPNGIEQQRMLNVEMVNIAVQRGKPHVATVDAHYPYADWADTQDVVLMMSTGQSLASRAEAKARGDDVYEFGEKSLYLMEEGEVREHFVKNHPDLSETVITQAIDYTTEVASWITPFIVDKSEKIPKVHGGVDEAYRIIRDWCEDGLQRIGKDKDPKYREQLEHEIGILKGKQVLDYFVIIGDMVRWAKKEGVRVGAGRGSAAGCLVSYLCGITSIDPIAHGLLFERFLNPHREGLPDIDLDFQHDRRNEVKAYLGERWGSSHVADIVAHQTFGMRAAIQGVARVHDVDYDEVHDVTDTFTDATGELNLDVMRTISKKLDGFADRYPEVWKHARRVEGSIKAISKHAAGVVVTDKPVSDYMPTMRGNDGTTVTAWSERAEFPIISEYGFLKIDVLGTDGLTIQNRALDLIEERTGERPDLDALTADPRSCDKEVLAAFGKDLTLGVFQFESRGIRGLLRQIKPEKLGDVVAANALYRPGPLEGGIAFEYGERKNGRLPITYWHESVREHLEETYGLMVYQEQVMQIVQSLGGFTLAEADLVRKAMTKWQSTKIKTNKGRKAMNEFLGKFIEGCAEKGVSKEEAQRIWDMILQFSIYGFNKSHSAGYAAQAYQDMWLKLNFPLEFYAALLTFETAKVPAVIRECQARGIKILPPDINRSGRGFTVDGDAIRFGLEAIRHVGDAAIEEITSKQPFLSFDDFDDRIVRRKCNARVINALKQCGAFDCFGERDNEDARSRARLEHATLGFALSTAGDISKHRELITSKIDTEDYFDEAQAGTAIVLGGEVIACKEITTKRGDQMAFVDVAFDQQRWDVTVFPKTWERNRHLLAPGSGIMVKGKKDDRGNVIMEHVCDIEELAKALEEKDET